MVLDEFEIAMKNSFLFTVRPVYLLCQPVGHSNLYYAVLTEQLVFILYVTCVYLQLITRINIIWNWFLLTLL